MMAIILPVVAYGCVGASVPQPHPVAPPTRYALPVPIVQPLPPDQPKPAPRALVSAIEQAGRQFDGLAGIAVVSEDDGWTAQYNGTRRMPQQSVSKLWVAMTLLDLRDQGRLTLNDPVTITRNDLTLFHQPIAALVKGDGYDTTVGDLLHRALTMSDNTANDRLLNFVGGPSVVRAFIDRKGLGDIRFGPGERLLQSRTAGLEWKQSYSLGSAFYTARANLPASVRRTAFDGYVADPPDGAAPASIAKALVMLKQGLVLKPDSTAFLISTMEESKTGKQRLRGAVPAGWRFGHKTGTGQDFSGHTAGYNDVGLLTAPDGTTYGIAVMIGDTGRTIPQRQALMHTVVASVVANHRR